MAALHQSYSFRDHRGYVARFNTFVNVLGNALALVVPTSALTNAQFVGANGPYTAKGSATVFGSNATFPNAEDKAVLVMMDTSNNLHRFEIPAPILGIFKVDAENVDITNASVVAWANAMIANAQTPSGLSFSAIVSGGRRRRKNRRDLPGVANPTP